MANHCKKNRSHLVWMAHGVGQSSPTFMQSMRCNFTSNWNKWKRALIKFWWRVILWSLRMACWLWEMFEVTMLIHEWKVSGEGDGYVGWDQVLGFLCVSNSFTENWWSLSLLMRQVGGPNFVLQLIQITKIS